MRYNLLRSEKKLEKPNGIIYPFTSNSFVAAGGAVNMLTTGLEPVDPLFVVTAFKAVVYTNSTK